MPFPCGEVWKAYTYSGHSPSNLSVDLDFPGGSAGRSVLAGVFGTAYTYPNNGGYGNLVEVVAGDGWTYRYAHLASFSVANGQVVAPQTEIGKVGLTGTTTGYHLHYEQRFNGAVQPATFGGGAIQYVNYPDYRLYTSGNCDRYVMGDVNADGRADLVIIGTGPTGSGKLEAHALNGATGFSTWIGNWATAAGYGNASTEYVMGDVNGDGRAELVLVATGPTGSGKLEVHALNGATAYSTWLGNWASAAGYGNSTNRYVM
jgi:hypothetical protein